MFFETWLGIKGVSRLSLAHHVEHFYAAQRNGRAYKGLETQHRAHTMLDSAMVLFDAVIELRALPDTDWLKRTPRSLLQPTLAITFEDGLPVCLAAVNDEMSRPAVTCKRLAQIAWRHPDRGFR